MLLVGTSDHLEDLDRQFTVAEDVDVCAIASRPGAPSGTGVFALVDAERVLQVGGDEVVEIGRVAGGGAQSLAATGDALVVGVRDARLVRMEERSGAVTPLRGFDAVPGRESWDNPAGASPDLRSIALSAAGTWLVNVHVGGLWRSDDQGENWTNVIPPDDDVHEVVAAPTGTLAVAAARGVGWSSDDGNTWQWTADGLHASYCRAVALGGTHIYVSASTGPSSTDGRLYRATLGSPFTQCGDGLPSSFGFNLDTGSLAARTTQVALGTRDGRVFRSEDSGSTFAAVTERVGHVRVVRFV